MEKILFVLFIIIGLLAGTISGLLFFQSDKAWKSKMTLTLGGGGFLGVFFTIFKLSNCKENLFVPLLTLSLISLFISFIVTIFLLARSLESQKSRFKVIFLDILLGKNYFDDRIRERKLLEMELGLNEKEKIIKQSNKYIEKEFNDIRESKKSILTLSLPVGKEIPVDDKLIDTIPIFCRRLANFTQILREVVLYAVNKKDEKNEHPKRTLKGFLHLLCVYASKSLFDSENIRTHVRILQNDVYVGFVCCVGSKKYKENLTQIPVDSGMIHEAKKCKRSIIKSLNPDKHFQSKHDHIWIDYISFTFDDIRDPITDNPLLSMAISTKDENYNKPMFLLLNFCKIEQIIQSEFKYFIKKCGIENIEEQLFSEKLI